MNQLITHSPTWMQEMLAHLKTGNTMMVKQKSFEIWLHLDVHLQEIVEIVVCNSDIGFKKIGESLYTTKILASKKLLKVSMPPRYWLRRNW